MILSGRLIREVLKIGSWKSNTSVELLNIGPNSVDVTLSDNVLIPNFKNSDHTNYVLDPVTNTIVSNNLNGKDTYDLNDHKLFKEFVIPQSGFILNPGEFILGSVNESFNCMEPYENKVFAPMYEGRSTLARIGLLSHISAAFGDYGFNGSFTLEIVNLSPWSIKLTPDMRIGQVYFQEVYNKGDAFEVDDIYNGYDQTDCKPQAPRLGKGRFFHN
ncbi:trimeric dUTP diphosphatase [Yersinia phage YerA41]|uniref:Trimeric dUTP diphosphatase n=1 Tax=Yersinia phage vB_Yru_GN1 TaxID=3074381 RepID=A0AA86JHP9_9CAUD|nr:trimeric dUTP diphosphatase [Yersinia phage YerA41]BES79880.1 Trimeric dUTP diphosphatase [Yersinia phage vB_Yru_GN1]